jgi:hypothetical protein
MLNHEYTTKTIVSFGIHQNKPLGKVPASYLLYLYESQDGITNEKLLKYVEDNYSRLESERTKAN